MSLLMDALRKAEEEKKKAEQEESQQGAAPEASESASAEDISAGGEDAAVPVTPPVEKEPLEEISQVAVESDVEDSIEDAVGSDRSVETPIPDVPLEFEKEDSESSPAKEEILKESQEESQEEFQDEAREETQAESLPDVEVSPAIAELPDRPELKKEEAVSLSLEPIDKAASEAERKPFDQEFVPDYSAETPLKTLSRQVAASESKLPSDRSPEETVNQGTPAVELHGSPEATEESADDSLDVQAAPINIGSPQSKASPASPATAPPRRPSLKLTPKRQSLSERSEPDRKAARSVFAAKRKAYRPFRMRRSQRIWLLQIVAGLIIAVGGYYYFFAVGSQGNDFAIPEEFLANQGVYSEQFNSSLEELDVVEPVSDGTSDAGIGAEIVGATDIASPATGTSPVEVAAADLEVIVPAENQIETPPAIEQEVAVAAEPEAVEIDPVLESEAPAIDESPGVPASDSISFTRTASTPGVDPILQQAYAAFQRDDMAVAQDLYQRVLQESPRHRDALLGLAAISASNNETAVAMELYSRLLARDPSDAVARAGLLGIRPAGGPEQQERELRRLVEQQSEVAPVLYALGNFYASQSRWNEAQRLYFNALQQAKTDALEDVPVHPDYAFNLAVSLEQLNQVNAALTYYNEAIAFSANLPASFDLNIARSRVASLEGVASE